MAVNMLAEVGHFNSGVYEELLTLGISLKLPAFGPIGFQLDVTSSVGAAGDQQTTFKEIFHIMTRTLSPVLLIFTSFISSP